MENLLILKVDVDTLGGTKKGIPILINLFKKYNIRGTFFVSLGRDNTGKKIIDVFKKGFLKKMARTSALKVYGLKNVLYGFLLPAPLIYKKAEKELKSISENGFETGIHSYDHVYWHTHLLDLSETEIENIMNQSMDIYYSIYKKTAKSFAAPGWTISENYLKVIDKYNFNYVSSIRGNEYCYPELNDYKSNTLEIPTNLATLDELVGLKSFAEIKKYYISEIVKNKINIMTIHSELEGGYYKDFFESLIIDLLKKQIKITDFNTFYTELNKNEIPVKKVEMNFIEGRAIKVGIII